MKIISDGTIAFTKVMTDDGHVIDGITEIAIYGKGGDDFLMARLVIRLSSLNIRIEDKAIVVLTEDADGRLIDLVKLQKNIRGENSGEGDL